MVRGYHCRQQVVGVVKTFSPVSFLKQEARSSAESEEWGGVGEHVKRLKTFTSHLESDETEYDQGNLVWLRDNIMGLPEVMMINLMQAQQYGFTGMEQAKNWF